VPGLSGLFHLWSSGRRFHAIARPTPTIIATSNERPNAAMASPDPTRRTADPQFRKAASSEDGNGSSNSDHEPVSIALDQAINECQGPMGAPLQWIVDISPTSTSTPTSPDAYTELIVVAVPTAPKPPGTHATNIVRKAISGRGVTPQTPLSGGL